MTEILAWIVRSDAALARAFVSCLDEQLVSRGMDPLPGGAPRATTQVVVGHGTDDHGRCDLVLEWDEPTPTRVIVEVKIAAAAIHSGGSST